MATLYLGVERRPDGLGQVALKVVHPHLAKQSDFLTMLRDEARLASRIHHPNVVRIEGLREHDGIHYLVMEYVPGRSAAQLLDALVSQGRKTPVRLAAAIIRRVAEGLHAAHEAVGEDGVPLELVHRDISPGNILLSRSGEVKLIDFGIAKARGRQFETRENRVRGKLRYLAPEQARGRALDRRADVYALAVVLWEMLTLKRYALGQSESSVLKCMQRPSRRPVSAVRNDVPPELEAVLSRALDPDPNRRFQSASAFAEALARAVPASRDVTPAEIAELATDDSLEPAAPRVSGVRRRRERSVSPPPRPLASLRPRGGA